MNTDNELMFKVKNGEIEKLGLLFERHKRLLFAYFYRSTMDQQASEDLVQIVFMKILKYRHNFSGTGKFTTWMYRIAHNASIDFFRKNQRCQDLETLHATNFTEEQTPENEMLHNEKMQLLNIAMTQLSVEHRNVLLLSKYQQLKYKEIGEILNCSENTVKIKVFRALAELKQKYKQLDKS